MVIIMMITRVSCCLYTLDDNNYDNNDNNDNNNSM